MLSQGIPLSDAGPQTPLIVPAGNPELFSKIMNSPVVYIREDPKCCLCPETYKVYIYSAVITDQQYDVLKDLVFSVVDDACSVCCESCSHLNFYGPSGTDLQFFVAFPGCLEDCCKDCCKCGGCCQCNCVQYGQPLRGYYGNTRDNFFGWYAKRFCGLCSPFQYCNSDTYEFFGKMQDSRLLLKVNCWESFNPCINCYPLHFHLFKGQQDYGVITRSPRGCCGTFTYEIQFPPGLTLEERLLLIAFCCKRT